MSRHHSRLTQDPRVMAAVLVVLAVLVVARLGALLPKSGPVAAQAAPDDDLLPPLDLRKVRQASLRYMDDVASPRSTRAESAGPEGFNAKSMQANPRNPFEYGERSAASGVPGSADAGASVEADLLQCSAILFSGGRGSAIIGGRTVHVGDEIDGFQVERIDTAGVQLRGRDRTLFLPLDSKM